MYWWKHIPTSNISNQINKVRSQMINLVNYTGTGKKHLMMLITFYISGCITIICYGFIWQILVNKWYKLNCNVSFIAFFLQVLWRIELLHHFKGINSPWKPFSSLPNHSSCECKSETNSLFYNWKTWYCLICDILVKLKPSGFNKSDFTALGLSS